jgi:malate synthase
VNEPHSLAPYRRALRERQHRSRQIDPHYSAVWRDCPGKVQRRLAAATAYVQDALARTWGERLQCAPTKRSQLQFQ